jgi:DNA-directed RNA polymerase subunit RPC12/RpoP
MTVYEVLTIAIIVVLGTAATAGIYLGLLNWIGAAYIVRCATCRHLTVSPERQQPPSCAHCRHPVLMHPVHAAHHPREFADVRVVRDSLKY